MSDRSAVSVPYHLRPNKAVDRELFLDLLGYVSSPLHVSDYRYIGLGGPFLQDFKVIHTRTGIQKMTCVERKEKTHRRQKFNVGCPRIECVFADISEYLAAQSLEEDRCIIWIDHSKGSPFRSKIQEFARLAAETAPGSILRITLPAMPPDAEGLQEGDLEKKRREVVEEDLGDLLPYETDPRLFRRTQFGIVLLQALELSLERALEGAARAVIPAFTTLYDDGQPMVTATIVCDEKPSAVGDLLQLAAWEFRTALVEPHRIDMPVLSSHERIQLLRYFGGRSVLAEDDQLLEPDDLASLDFVVPSHGVSESKDGVFESFRKFYRFYPHFGRVEL